MALVVKDRVREITVTAGSGAVALSGAISGFQGFSSIGDGNTTYYTIADSATGDWEVGIGTYTSSGSTLSRDTVLSSSNGGALVVFGGGPKDVFVTYPAERSVIGGMGYVENAIDISQSSTINAGTNALSVGPVVITDGASVTVPSGSRWVIL